MKMSLVARYPRTLGLLVLTEEWIFVISPYRRTFLLLRVMYVSPTSEANSLVVVRGGVGKASAVQLADRLLGSRARKRVGRLRSRPVLSVPGRKGFGRAVRDPGKASAMILQHLKNRTLGTREKRFVTQLNWKCVNAESGTVSEVAVLDRRGETRVQRTWNRSPGQMGWLRVTELTLRKREEHKQRLQIRWTRTSPLPPCAQPSTIHSPITPAQPASS